MRHFHLQWVQVMENKTNLTLVIYFLYLHKALLQIITNSQNTLVLRLKQIIKGW